MSSVYGGEVQSALRGVALLPSGEVLIQDELTGLHAGSRVRWGMVTPADADGFGQRVITLRQSDKQLMLTLRSPDTVGWTRIDTATPPNEWDSPNAGTQMVAFEAAAPETGELTLVVVATPKSCRNQVASTVGIKPLQRWSRRPKPPKAH
jgi:hypothetical protein